MIEFFNVKFNIFDISVLTILIFSGIVGYNNGFIKEIFNVIIWLVSIFTTFLFFDQSIYFVSQYINISILVNLISFLIPFFLFFIIFTILFKLLFNNLNEVSNLLINNFLGSLFGI